jgi:TPP-dependent pyruvate/acetoin dehydrogenase alpha subunit
MVEVKFEEWEKDKIVEEYWQEALRLVQTRDSLDRLKARVQGQKLTEEQLAELRRRIKEKIEAQGEWKEVRQHVDMMKIIMDAFPEDAS